MQATGEEKTSVILPITVLSNTAIILTTLASCAHWDNKDTAVRGAINYLVLGWMCSPHNEREFRSGNLSMIKGLLMERSWALDRNLPLQLC